MSYKIKSFLLLLVACCGICALRPSPLRAADPFDPNVPLSVRPLGGNVYWVSVGAWNTGFVVGTTGVIVYDTQLLEATTRKQRAAIAKITSKPIEAIFLSHSDPSAINGLPYYPRSVEIIATPECKAGMIQALTNPPEKIRRALPPPELKDYLPTTLVERRADLVRAGVRVTAIHVGPAHTDGDMALYLPDQKIVFAGDILAPELGPHPGLHLWKGGSSLGWIAFVKALVELDANTYVPGHGELLTKAQVKERLHAAIERREKIAALVKQGKTLDEIKAVFNDPPPFSTLFPTYTETTYEELTRK